MQTMTQYWNPKQKRLKSLLSKKEPMMEGIAECARLHAELHRIRKSDRNIYTEALSRIEDICDYQPKGYFYTPAWDIWHITRIEDAIANILIDDGAQVFSADWKRRIGAAIRDTGACVRRAPRLLGEKDCRGFPPAPDHAASGISLERLHQDLAKA
jgi:hypothetical protein